VGGPPPGAPPIPTPPGMPKSFPKSAEAEKLTESQRKMLKDMHEHYATVGKSALLFRVTGEGDQSYNIELPHKGGPPK
jgi:hypothetical protein